MEGRQLGSAAMIIAHSMKIVAATNQRHKYKSEKHILTYGDICLTSDNPIVLEYVTCYSSDLLHIIDCTLTQESILKI